MKDLNGNKYVKAGKEDEDGRIQGGEELEMESERKRKRIAKNLYNLEEEIIRENL